jgi:hypothetical protein
MEGSGNLSAMINSAAGGHTPTIAWLALPANPAGHGTRSFSPCRRPFGPFRQPLRPRVSPNYPRLGKLGLRNEA